MKKKLLSTILACAMVLTMAGCQKKDEGIYTAGTYTASAEGMNGPVKVSVTVSESEITDIQVVEHSETAGLSDPAVENMPGKIKEAQSTEVDAESGCTITSEAIKTAVAAALAQAKGEAPVGGDEEDGTLDLPFDQADVIIVGAGFAGLNASLAAVEAGAKVILIDKNSTTGGSIRYAGGTLSGAGTKMQAEANVVDSPELLYQDFVDKNANIGGNANFNEELARFYAEHSGEAVDWLDSLGADLYVAGLVASSAGAFMNFLPAIIFVVGCFLAFATGTSWGTFGILIPIVVNVFLNSNPQLMIISISACMAGAVCGDHCSPISDTTIMASAGAQCNHVNHVTTQLPYALLAAGISFFTYLVAGFVQNPWVPLPIGIILLLLCLFGIKANQKPQE